MTIHIDCGYEYCSGHDYPDDWRLGGADGLSPAADPRWLPTTYIYYDAKLQEIFTTQGPDNCDEEAFDLFTWISSLPGFKPIYVAVKRPGEEKLQMLPVKYDPATDTVSDTGVST